LIFGAEDLAAARQSLIDYGLKDVGDNYFEALDGTGVTVLAKDDPSLPPALETGTQIRKTVYGVADEATLQQIYDELSKDREVKKFEDGSLESVDDMGFVLGFEIIAHRDIGLPAEAINAPGANSRDFNELGVEKDAPLPSPRSLSHVVYFVPDAKKAEDFYVNRLGFIPTDRFTGVGAFMRPAGMTDHHSLFFLQTPPHMKGIEHFTFHMGGPTDVMRAGYNYVEKGYESFWGPGRHIFGSNWFWYFKSPLGCNIEYDADMDLHDDSWTAREVPMSEDNSQVFLFRSREKWAPGGPPPGAAGGPPPGKE
jgi:catechol 2,3-dioxygenase-like lactoylglutathione lyase family enzyme